MTRMWRSGFEHWKLLVLVRPHIFVLLQQRMPLCCNCKGTWGQVIFALNIRIYFTTSYSKKVFCDLNVVRHIHLPPTNSQMWIDPCNVVFTNIYLCNIHGRPSSIFWKWDKEKLYLISKCFGFKYNIKSKFECKLPFLTASVLVIYLKVFPKKLLARSLHLLLQRNFTALWIGFVLPRLGYGVLVYQTPSLVLSKRQLLGPFEDIPSWQQVACLGWYSITCPRCVTKHLQPKKKKACGHCKWL